jgi:hypothetical protein
VQKGEGLVGDGLGAAHDDARGLLIRSLRLPSWELSGMDVALSAAATALLSPGAPELARAKSRGGGGWRKLRVSPEPVSRSGCCQAVRLEWWSGVDGGFALSSAIGYPPNLLICQGGD